MQKVIDTLEVEIISDAQVEKLEKVKDLLTEIKQLKEDIFSKQDKKYEVGRTAL